MKPTVETANEAKRQLLEFNSDTIESAIIVLGNDGFRIEVVVKPRMKWVPPGQVLGVPVVRVC
jgi:hypothetical protein